MRWDTGSGCLGIMVLGVLGFFGAVALGTAIAEAVKPLFGG